MDPKEWPFINHNVYHGTCPLFHFRLRDPQIPSPLPEMTHQTYCEKCTYLYGPFSLKGLINYVSTLNHVILTSEEVEKVQIQSKSESLQSNVEKSGKSGDKVLNLVDVPPNDFTELSEKVNDSTFVIASITNDR
jgi:hypothetical protein